MVFNSSINDVYPLLMALTLPGSYHKSGMYKMIVITCIAVLIEHSYFKSF